VTGTLLNLAEQQLVDCDTRRDQGCNGGLQQWAYTYLEGTKVEETSNYPYTAADGNCKATASAEVVGVSSYEFVTEDNASQMMIAANQQPLAVSVEADTRAW